MKPIIPGHLQSIFDIALQHSGSLEAIVDIAKYNNLSITDSIDTNPIIIPIIHNQRVVDHFALNQITPATEIVTQSNVLPEPEGIEFMTIEQNFMVF